MTVAEAGTLTHLRSAGVSVVVDSRGSRLPAIVHWGSDLGSLSFDDLTDLEMSLRAPASDSRIEVPERVAMLPSPADGWLGRPGITGSRAGIDFSPDFVLTRQSEVQSDDVIAAGVRYEAIDEVAQLSVVVEITLTISGLIRARAELGNSHPDQGYQLDGLFLTLPVGAGATELMDLTGRHARERVPQRMPWVVGTHARESRQGRPGLDSPMLLIAGQEGFGFEAGEAWGVHLGWSGNHLYAAERTHNGHQRLGVSELLLPGELQLEPGQRYESPWLFASYGNGLNELSGRFHRYLRSRPQHPNSPRPVTLNTWEAVYFRQDLPTLVSLARAGAHAGAERFVLDDGWFRGRRDDDAGLGDWIVDESVWPDGLTPLIDEVLALGMQFGLWVEPEMVNLDSDVAREHPEWIFRAGGRVGIPSRQQYVLDLGNSDAYAYIAGRMHALLSTYPISYLKWDHNRTVVEAGHGPTGRPGVHQHTLALYRLLDELKAQHPGLEIESCAGGGGRIDLGILERTDRVWASDCIDPLERQQIQRYTQLLLPPELIGTHVGAPEAHTTHRHSALGFRAGTALWGHAGIEWDLTRASEAEQGALAQWLQLHKQWRSLLHTGRVVVGDVRDPAIWLHGVVNDDATAGIFSVVAMNRSLTWPPGPVRLPGLNPDLSYDIEAINPSDPQAVVPLAPEWFTKGLCLPGRVLMRSGLRIPQLFPETLQLISVIARPATD